MDPLLLALVQIVITWAVVGVASLRLAVHLGEPRLWRAGLPFFNMLFMAALTNVDRGMALIFALLVFTMAPSIIFVLPFLAGRYAASTGRRRWVGWILSLPPLPWIGLLVLAATVSRRQVESVGSARA